MLNIFSLISAFSIGANGGYLSTTQEYDSVGKIKDYNGSYNLLNFGVFGKYSFSNFYLESDLQFSKIVDIVNGTSKTSGFSPQFLNLLVGIVIPFTTIKGGFHWDLGPTFDYSPYKIPNSDRQNALLFGLLLSAPVYDVHLNLDYILTFKGNEKNLDYDVGDFIILALGGSYKLSSFVFGMEFIYSMKTKGTVIEGTELVEYPEHSLFSLLPYVSYEIKNLNIYMKLGASGEYGYYGISLFGKNEIRSKGGLTLGIALKL